MPEPFFKIKLQDISDVLVTASERNNFIQSNADKIKKVSLTFQLTFLLFISKSKKVSFARFLNLIKLGRYDVA